MRKWKKLDANTANNYRISPALVSDPHTICYSLDGPSDPGEYQYWQLMIIQMNQNRKWLKIFPRAFDEETMIAMDDIDKFFLSDEDKGGSFYLNKSEIAQTLKVLQGHARNLKATLEVRKGTFQMFTMSQFDELGIDVEIYRETIWNDLMELFLQTDYPSSSDTLTLIELGQERLPSVHLRLTLIDLPSVESNNQAGNFLSLLDNSSGSICLDKQGVEHFCDLLTEQLKRFEVGDKE